MAVTSTPVKLPDAVVFPNVEPVVGVASAADACQDGASVVPLEVRTWPALPLASLVGAPLAPP